jgi:hypothetical protein
MNNRLKVITRRAYEFKTYRATEVALYHSLGRLPEPQDSAEEPKHEEEPSPGDWATDVGAHVRGRSFASQLNAVNIESEARSRPARLICPLLDTLSQSLLPTEPRSFSPCTDDRPRRQGLNRAQFFLSAAAADFS